MTLEFIIIRLRQAGWAALIGSVLITLMLCGQLSVTTRARSGSEYLLAVAPVVMGVLIWVLFMAVASIGETLLALRSAAETLGNDVHEMRGMQSDMKGIVQEQEAIDLRQAKGEEGVGPCNGQLL